LKLHDPEISGISHHRERAVKRVKFLHSKIKGETMSTKRKVGFHGVVVILALLASSCAFAQEPATSLDQLRLQLAKGDKITVVDASGKSIKGRVENIAPDALAINAGGETRSLREDDIRQITRRKPDSALNGILIGAGVGFGATLPVFLSFAESDEKGMAVAAAGIWGLVGAGIGALVDVAVQEKQTVYFHPKSHVSWSISPIYRNSAFRIQPTGGQSFQPSQPNNGTDPTKGLALTIRF
jgi:hypothetical protein